MFNNEKNRQKFLLYLIEYGTLTEKPWTIQTTKWFLISMNS